MRGGVLLRGGGSGGGGKPLKRPKTSSPSSPIYNRRVSCWRFNFTVAQWLFLCLLVFVALAFVASFERIAVHRQQDYDGAKKRLQGKLVFLGGVPGSGTGSLFSLLCAYAGIGCLEQERQEGSNAIFPEIVPNFHASTNEGNRLESLVDLMLDKETMHQWMLTNRPELQSPEHAEYILTRWQQTLEHQQQEQVGFDAGDAYAVIHRHHPHIGRLPFLGYLFGDAPKFIISMRHPGHFAAYNLVEEVPKLHGWLQLHEIALGHARAVGKARALMIRIEEFSCAPLENTKRVLSWLGVRARLQLRDVPYDTHRAAVAYPVLLEPRTSGLGRYRERLRVLGYALWPSEDPPVTLCPELDLCRLRAASSASSSATATAQSRPKGRVLSVDDIPCTLSEKHRNVISRLVLVGGAHASGTSVTDSLIKLHPQVAGLVNTKKPEDEGQHVQHVFPPANQVVAKHRVDSLMFHSDWANIGLPSYSHLLQTSSAGVVCDSWMEFLQENWSDFDNTRVILEKSPPNLGRIGFLNFLFMNAPRFVMVLRAPTRYKYQSTSIENWLVVTEHARNTAFAIGGADRVVFIRMEQFSADIHKWLRILFEWLGLDVDAMDWSLVVQLPNGPEADKIPSKRPRKLLIGKQVFDVDHVPEGGIGVLPVPMKQSQKVLSDEQEHRLNVIGYTLREGMALLPYVCPALDLCQCDQ